MGARTALYAVPESPFAGRAPNSNAGRTFLPRRGRRRVRARLEANGRARFVMPPFRAVRTKRNQPGIAGVVFRHAGRRRGWRKSPVSEFLRTTLAEIIRCGIGPPWFSSLTIRQRPLRRLRTEGERISALKGIDSPAPVTEGFRKRYANQGRVDVPAQRGSAVADIVDRGLAASSIISISKLNLSYPSGRRWPMRLRFDLLRVGGSNPLAYDPKLHRLYEFPTIRCACASARATSLCGDFCEPRKPRLPPNRFRLDEVLGR
jgi:hypothetical protein